MSCMTLFMQPAAMATTRLVDAVRREESIFWPAEYLTERNQPLTMSWVVVTGENGERQLRMRWRTPENPVN